MKGPNFFQIGILVIFTLFIFGAVLYFALFKGAGAFGSAGSVVIWGTLPANIMIEPLATIKKKESGIDSVSYVEKDPRTYENDILEALASGKGPDLILLSEDRVMANLDRITLIPYTSLSERTFKDTFIEEADLLLFPKGIVGLPFYFDPLVMYWNRDMFATAGLATPPDYWDEFFTIIPKLTKRDNNQNILRSGLAFGEYDNVTHAKDILALLMLQAGTPIVVRNGDRLAPNFELNVDGGNPEPGAAALRFYTEFSNPIKNVYSWHRALPESRQMFLSGDLAIYFGFASEYRDLKRANPNLNFDLKVVPQSRTAKRRTSYGTLTSFMIPKLAKNPSGAYIAETILVRSEPLQIFGDRTEMPPVRRDLLATPQTDAYKSVTYGSAIIARSWLDPDSDKSDAVFQTMVNQITAGRKELSKALSEAESELANLFQ